MHNIVGDGMCAGAGAPSGRRRITRAVHASLMAIVTMYRQTAEVSVRARIDELYTLCVTLLEGFLVR